MFPGGNIVPERSKFDENVPGWELGGCPAGQEVPDGSTSILAPLPGASQLQ